MKTINKINTVTALVSAAIVSAGFAPNTVWARGHQAGTSASTAALERRLEQMEAELQALRSELSAARSEAQAEARAASDKIEAQQQKVDQQLTAAEEKEERKDNMVFFRGGYANMVNGRSNQVFSDLYGPANGFPTNVGRDGTYFGAGLDFSITDDLFGLVDGVEVLGELMFDWKRLDSSDSGTTGSFRVVPVAANALGVNQYVAANGRGVTLSMFTLSASPKIKFLKDSAFRPWIIPAGMAFNVISPPSDAGTVLTPGVLFGIGADYNVWKNIYLGLDGRYMLSADDVDGVKASNYSIGGYIGLGF